MPVFVSWIGEMLLSLVGQMALSALVSLGIGLAAQSLFSGVIDHSAIAAAFAASGAGQAIGFFGLDKAMTIILSAWAGRRIVDAAKVHFVARPKAGG